MPCDPEVTRGLMIRGKDSSLAISGRHSMDSGRRAFGQATPKALAATTVEYLSSGIRTASNSGTGIRTPASENSFLFFERIYISGSH